MLVCAAIALVNLSPSRFVIDSCSAAQGALSKATITLNVDSQGVLNRERVMYVLSYDRATGADLTVSGARTLRVVATQNGTYQYDPQSRQYAYQDRPNPDIVEALRRSVGIVDELVTALYKPDGLGPWLKALATADQWTWDFSGGQIAAVAPSPVGKMAIVMDPKTRLLRRVSYRTDRYGTDWTLSYGTPPSAIGFVPPQGSFETKEISPLVTAPTYASNEARTICERVFSRYDHPKALGYQVSGEGESMKVWVAGDRAKQDDAHATWVLAGNDLSLWDKKGSCYVTGKTSLGQIVDSVARTGTRVEPLLRLMLRGINPMRFYLGQHANVSLTGRTKVQGEPCSILQGDSATNGVSLIVRNRDGFVLSLTSLFKGPTSEQSAARVYTPLTVTSDVFQVAQPPGTLAKSVSEYAQNK